MKENSIIINKRYFNNIEKAVNSLNQFFSSNFQQKNLLKVDDVSDLDEGMKNVLESIDTVDSRWVTDPELAADAADKLNEAKDDVKDYIMDKEEEGQDFLSYCEEKGKTSLFNIAKEFLSFKALEQISDNMPIFEKLLNGIYSFELFTTPSKYKKEIETFTQNVPKGECSDVLGDTKYSVFDIKGYVTGLFENDDIELPEDMDITKEVNRVSEFKDLDPNVKVTVNESITEAAEVNYFASTKPSHIKYEKGKWQVSTQFEKVVDDLIAGLRKCDSSDDLKSFIESKASTYTKTLEATVFPFILVQAFIKKANITATKYADSYKSIVSKNGGAKRFENYDIFTTFRSDKEGTLKFISDFCKLKLVNDPRAKIANNTLLTLFNIFDSRIYFDIMYNMIPDKEKKDKGMDEDSFVRKHRAVINNNSRGSNPYQKESNTDDTESTSGEIKEQVYDMIRSMGDMSISDMELCESWHDMLHDEIKTVDDALYNAGIPVSATCEYIGESFNVTEDMDIQAFMETKQGSRLTAKRALLGYFLGRAVMATVFLGLHAANVSWVMALDYATIGGLGNTAGLIGGQIGRGIAARVRAPGIKGEILEDIKSVLECLGKEIPSSSKEDFKSYKKDLKKRLSTLMESIRTSMLVKKNFDDSERVLVSRLLSATSRMKYGLKFESPDANAEIIQYFFEVSDKVIKKFTDITDADVKKLPIVKAAQKHKDDDEPAITFIEVDEDGEPIQETDDGSIPEYMKTRMKMSDENGNTRQATITTAEVPSNDGNVPSNSIDDLAMSIDAKINASDDDINDVIGKEAKTSGSHIVYNVTNNYTYTNSFNKTTTADMSQNKHIDHSVHADKTADLSNTNKSNNKYNSTGSSDTKDTLKVQEFSTGYSVEEVFAFLGSEEPLLEASGTKPPKEDSLTKAMDRDRKTLPKQQAAKKAVDKAVGTAKAVTKPVSRTKQWLLGIVDSLVKRREDKVKADIIENPSYRTALFKACRIALKIGLTGVAFTISGYLGGAYLLLQASDAYDKQRLRKEVEREFATEMKILDKKIQLAEQDDTPESRQALYKMMRLRSKMEQIATKEAVGAKFVHPTASQ